MDNGIAKIYTVGANFLKLTVYDVLNLLYSALLPVTYFQFSSIIRTTDYEMWDHKLPRCPLWRRRIMRLQCIHCDTPQGAKGDGARKQNYYAISWLLSASVRSCVHGTRHCQPSSWPNSRCGIDIEWKVRIFIYSHLFILSLRNTYILFTILRRLSGHFDGPADVGRENKWLCYGRGTARRACQ